VKRSIIFAALVLGAAVSARAQVPGPNSTQTRPDSVRGPNSIREDERRMDISRAQMSRMEREAAAKRSRPQPTLKARLVVTNRGASAIKSVAWVAALTDHFTGEVLRTYEVTTNKRIAPGKSATLEKKLPAPRVGEMDASASLTSLITADLKTSVVRITYEDGSTSAAP
jgi:hypothetical protein